VRRGAGTRAGCIAGIERWWSGDVSSAACTACLTAQAAACDAPLPGMPRRDEDEDENGGETRRSVSPECTHNHMGQLPRF
jgi:hypothetical protein